MNTVKIVCAKELARVFKDKKMVFSMFILPVIILIGMYALIFMMISNVEDDVKEHVNSVYIVDAPADFKNIIDSTDNKDNITYLKWNADLSAIKDDIKNGKADLIIEFPITFAAQVAIDDGSMTPDIHTYYNPSEDYSSMAKSNYSVIIEMYRQQLLGQRIGDVNKLVVFTVDADNKECEIYDDEKATGKMLGSMVPYMVTILLFATAMSIGIDVFTGEKERGTMAALLITPVNRTSIAMGKIVALMIMSVLSALIYVITMVVGFPLLVKNFAGEDSGNMFEGLSISFTVTQFIQITILIIGLVFLYVALVALVAVFAKTIKEANTYVLPLYFVVIFGGMTTMYGNSKEGLVQYLIPICNGPTAIKAIFEQTITVPQMVVAAISIYALAVVVTLLIGKLFNNEKVMQSS